MSIDERKRKIYGLRYRMKKRGYRFDGRNHYCYMPDDPTNRSKLMERRLVSLGYGIEYNMLHLFAENGGVTVFWCAVLCTFLC